MKTLGLIEEARFNLTQRVCVKRGDTIYTVLRHVSRSGMQRNISLFIMQNNRPRCLDGNAAQVIDWRLDMKRDGIIVKGSGMDMGFHLVHTLAAALFDDGYALKQVWL